MGVHIDGACVLAGGAGGVTVDDTKRQVKDGLCANCAENPSDTSVSFEETVFSEYKVRRISRMQSERSQRRLAKYGTVRLCAQCAAAYRRSVAVRERAHKVINWSFAALAVSLALYFVLTATNPALTQGMQALFPAVPFLLSLLALAVVMRLVGMQMRRTAARFV
jgi:hypothetical protein